MAMSTVGHMLMFSRRGVIIVRFDSTGSTKLEHTLSRHHSLEYNSLYLMSKVHYSTIWMVDSNGERTTIALNSKPTINHEAVMVGLGRSRIDLIVETNPQRSNQ